MMRLVLALALAGAASAEVITISVSGGSFNFPYYTFNGMDHMPELVYGNTYEFVDGGVSSSHPFTVGPGNGAKSGLPTTVTVGDDGVEYVCQIHSNMASSFDINPASTPTPTPTPDEGGDDGDDGDGDGDDDDDDDAAMTTFVRKFFKKQVASLRSIWSKNRQNRSHPRDFSAV